VMYSDNRLSRHALAVFIAMAACGRANQPSPALHVAPLGEETDRDYVGDISIARDEQGRPSTPQPDDEFVTPHPHSPWARVRVSISCPACADMSDPVGAAAHVRDSFDFALTPVAPANATVRPFDWDGVMEAGGAPYFWELPTLARARIDLTSNSFYEAETLAVHTGPSRHEQHVRIPMVPGRALGNGVTAVRADGVVVHVTADGRIVRPVLAENPFGLERVETPPHAYPRPLAGPLRAIFAPSGDLLVRVPSGWRVIDGQTFAMLDGLLPPFELAVFSHGGTRRALGRLARVHDNGDTRLDPIVVGWSDGAARVLAIETISTENDDRSGLALSGDGKVYGWVSDGFPASRRVDGTYPDQSFQLNTSPPPFARLFLGHDGETHYVLFHDGAGGMTLWVNGRPAQVGVVAFAVSRTRPGAIAVTRGFDRSGNYLHLNVHDPSPTANPDQPWRGNWERLPLSGLSPDATFETCGSDPDETLAFTTPRDTRFDIADITQAPGFAGAEVLVVSDGAATLVLDAATGAEIERQNGFWTCFRRSDDIVVLRQGQVSGGERVRACPMAGDVPVVQSGSCEVRVVSHLGLETAFDAVGDGFPMAGGHRVKLRPRCETTREPCGQAMVVRPDGTQVMTGIGDFGHLDPTLWIGATCLVHATERGVFCAR
jgi:hypothetical protein